MTNTSKLYREALRKIKRLEYRVEELESIVLSLSDSDSKISRDSGLAGIIANVLENPQPKWTVKTASSIEWDSLIFKRRKHSKQEK